MNPPFSAVANVDGRTTEATARHLRSALARLAPAGGWSQSPGPVSRRMRRLGGNLRPPDRDGHLVFTGAVSGVLSPSTAPASRRGSRSSTNAGAASGAASPPIWHGPCRPMWPPPCPDHARSATPRDGCGWSLNRSPLPFRGIPPRASGPAARPSFDGSGQDGCACHHADAEDLAYTLRETAEDHAPRACRTRSTRPSACRRSTSPARPAPDQAGAVGGHGLGRAPETDLPPETPSRRLLRDGLLSDAQLRP